MDVRPAAAELRLTALSGRQRIVRTAPLPAGFDYSALHSVLLQVRGDRARAELSQARLGDAFAV